MDIRTIETFCVIAENKSFSNTAKQLCVTQPTVSKQISQLEEELNVSLIDRTTKRVSLTRAGEIFYKYSMRILREVNTLNLVMSNFRGLKFGEVSIGASTLPGEYILPSIMSKFKLKYPDININLVIKDSFQIIKDISEGLMEIGIVGSKYSDKEVDYENFIEDEIVFAGKKNKIDRIDNLTTLEQLPIVNREKGSGTIHTVENFLKEKGFDYNKLKFIATVGSLTAVKQVMKQGLGYSFISKKAIKDETASKQLAIVDIQGITPIKRMFYIVYSKHFSLSPAAEKMKKLLMQWTN